MYIIPSSQHSCRDDRNSSMLHKPLEVDDETAFQTHRYHSLIGDL